MIPDIVCIWVSFFLAQRPTKADFSPPPWCHSTWRNALGNPLHEFDFHGKFTDPNFNPWWSVYFLGGIDRF
jgi:hypothetical protein